MRSQVYFARIRNEQHIELDCGTIKRKTLQTMAQPCAVLQQTVSTIFDKEKRKELTYIEEDKPLRKISGHYNSDADGKVPACGPSSRGNSNSLPTGLRSNVKLKQVVRRKVDVQFHDKKTKINLQTTNFFCLYMMLFLFILLFHKKFWYILQLTVNIICS